jgi:hypothetical protein
MNYAWDITIPALTLKTSPVTQILKLSKGVITKVEFKWPAGPQGLAHVALNYGEFQLIPLNRDDDISGDDETIVLPEYYELDEAPYQLKLYAWNDDDTYPHTVTVRITVLPKFVATLMPIAEFLGKLTRRIFGE